MSHDEEKKATPKPHEVEGGALVRYAGRGSRVRREADPTESVVVVPCAQGRCIVTAPCNRCGAGMTCSICDGIILADTEDWERPLCPDCYEGYERGAAEATARIVAALRHGIGVRIPGDQVYGPHQDALDLAADAIERRARTRSYARSTEK